VDTFEALGITILAVLPGALFTWSFEREVGNWGAGLADRVYRFVGFSAMFHAVFALPEYLLWASYLHVPNAAGHGYHDVFSAGGPVGPWVVLAPILYVGLPILAGWFAASSARRGGRFARVVIGRRPAPRAWDELFWREPSLLVRIKLHNGEWVGGLFGRNSYASGYPEPQDLLLEQTYKVLDDGTFAEGDTPEDFVEIGSSILLSWTEVQFLEAFDFTSMEDEGDA
jgi:hypothetical protein